MAVLLVGRLHLDHDRGGVVSEVYGVFLVEADAYHPPLPRDTLVLVDAIKLCHRSCGVSQETVEATVLTEFAPLEAGDGTLFVVVPGLCQHEQVDCETAGECQYDIQQVSAGEDDAELACLKSEQLVFEARKAEVRVALHFVEALGASVNG